MTKIILIGRIRVFDTMKREGLAGSSKPTKDYYEDAGGFTEKREKGSSRGTIKRKGVPPSFPRGGRSKEILESIRFFSISDYYCARFQCVYVILMYTVVKIFPLTSTISYCILEDFMKSRKRTRKQNKKKKEKVKKEKNKTRTHVLSILSLL